MKPEASVYLFSMYFPRVRKNFDMKYAIYLFKSVSAQCSAILMRKICWLRPSIDVKFDRLIPSSYYQLLLQLAWASKTRKIN
jgi:hypothetical protein